MSAQAMVAARRHCAALWGMCGARKTAVSKALADVMLWLVPVTDAIAGSWQMASKSPITVGSCEVGHLRAARTSSNAVISFSDRL